MNSLLRVLLIPVLILCMGQDAGSGDPCAVYKWPDVAPFVGCNGEPPGAQPDDAAGGACLASAAEPGTCTSSPICAGPDSAAGICVMQCPSVDDSTAATQTGGCPLGWRCWFTGLDFFCYPDCRADSDCGTGRCNDQRRCLPLRAPASDGGAPGDAGAADDAGSIGADGGFFSDASAPEDASAGGGVDEDAGATTNDAGGVDDDAGSAAFDASSTDAGSGPPPDEGGCGCTVAAGVPVSARFVGFFAIFVLVVRGRRRSRLGRTSCRARSNWRAAKSS